VSEIASVGQLHPRWLDREWRHGILAFGGGILFAAVALVLVPEGIRHLSVGASSATLLGGGGVFMLADRRLDRSGTPAAALLATLLDYAPEAIALGAMMQSRPAMGLLLAIFIGLQNLPEGFNSYRELVVQGGLPSWQVLTILSGLTALGPVCGLAGLALLSDLPSATSGVMLFAAGGILYLTFQDLAPQAHLKHRWAPALGAVLGFWVGLVGHLLIDQ
jgi:ZIP family zinc transporter